MAITFTDVDTNQKNSGSGSVTLSSVVSATDDVFYLFVGLGGSTSAELTSVTGHGTWAKIGNVEQASTRQSGTVWGVVVTSGTTADIVASFDSTGGCVIHAVKIQGVDVSSGVAGTYAQVKSTNDYSDTASVSLDSAPSDATIHFTVIHGNETATPIAGSSTEMSQSSWVFNQKSEFVEADTAGVQTPSITWDTSSHDWSIHVIELVAAGVGGPTSANDEYYKLLLAGGSL